MKKKLIIAIAAVVLVACVSVTFSLWLGNVEKKQSYILNMTDNFMYISSEDAVLESGKILSPGQSVTHKFTLKLKGSNAVVKIECTSIEFSYDGGVSYSAVAKDAVAVQFDKNNIDVNHAGAGYASEEVKSTISFLLSAQELDTKYENAKFRYTIKVSIAQKEVVNG